MRRWTTGNLVTGPTRSCLACRRREHKASLTRFTISGGTVVADPSARLPGRGAYLCQQQSCADAALAKGATRLRRALRAATDINVNEEVVRAAGSSRRPTAAPDVPHAGQSHSAGVSE